MSSKKKKMKSVGKQSTSVSHSGQVVELVDRPKKTNAGVKPIAGILQPERIDTSKPNIVDLKEVYIWVCFQSFQLVLP